MLRLVLPKGSLEKATLDLFEAADLPVVRSSTVDYQATIDDPRIESVRILRPQEIPMYVAEGLFDIGITGRDWVEETGSVVESLGELKYSKATSKPIKLVVAVAGDNPAASVKDLPHGVRVQSEYPELTKRFFADNGVDAEVRLSYGATEAKIPDIADCVVEITETGRALRAAGLKVIDTILLSYTEVVANPVSAQDPDKRKAMEQIMTLLNGVARRTRTGAAEAERERGTPGRGPGGAPVDEVADHVAAGRRGICRRVGRREEDDQPGDPGPQGRRRHRPRRDGDRQDRPVTELQRSTRTGTVAAFDESVGLGVVAGTDGVDYPFHCIEIADGSRSIPVGADVTFDLLAKLGRWEAANLRT